jgi:hypothetical protein
MYLTVINVGGKKFGSYKGHGFKNAGFVVAEEVKI